MGNCLTARYMARKKSIIEPEGGEEEQDFRDNRITKCGYAQQEISPYATRAVTVWFDRGKHAYTVPQHFVEKVPAFAALLKESRNYSISLFEADEDIGHIMVHYLYSGGYQTLVHDSHSTTKRPYRHSVFAYCAAINYKIRDLETMALRHIRELGDIVDIDHVIHTAREAFYKFPRPPGSYPRYLEHLKERLASAFEANEDGLEGIVSEVGSEPLSDRFLLEKIMSLYSLELSKLREENMALKTLNEELCEGKVQQMSRTDAIDMYYADYAECEDLHLTSSSVEEDGLETPPSEPDPVQMYSALNFIKDGKGKKRKKKGNNKKLEAK